MLKFDAPESGLMTWVDFSKRMQGTHISAENMELFYKKYLGFTFNYCQSKFDRLSKTFAEDFTQKLMTDLLTGGDILKRYKHEDGHSFRSWFVRVIYNKAIDYYRAHKKDPGFNSWDELTENIVDENDPQNSEDDKDLWQEYKAFLAYDMACERSTNKQIECFLWRVRDERKPAEIAPLLGMTAEQVSEAVRSFKDKIMTAMRELDEQKDSESADWKNFIQLAEKAKDKYMKYADDFSIRLAKVNDAKKKEN